MDLFALWEKIVAAFSAENAVADTGSLEGFEAPILLKEDLELVPIGERVLHDHSDIPYIPIEEYAAEMHRIDLGIDTHQQTAEDHGFGQAEQLELLPALIDIGEAFQADGSLGGGANGDILGWDTFTLQADASFKAPFRLFPIARDIFENLNDDSGSIQTDLDTREQFIASKVKELSQSIQDGSQDGALDEKLSEDVIPHDAPMDEPEIARHESCQPSMKFAPPPMVTHDFNINALPTDWDDLSEDHFETSLTSWISEQGESALEDADGAFSSYSDEDSGVFINLGSQFFFSLFWGTETEDNVAGSSHDDTIFGGTGDNIVLGLEGDDWIFASDGDDVVFAGEGDDAVTGEWGDDFLFGDSGSDLMLGGSGDDILFGGLGSDILLGESGWDFISGGAGADEIYGGSGNDIIKGGDGCDILYGGSGDDVYLYTAFTQGSDTLLFANNSYESDVLQFSIDVFSTNGEWTFTQGYFAGFYDGESLRTDTSSAAFVYDLDSGMLWHDDNGRDEGGETLIATIWGDDLDQDSIVVV